MTVLYIPVANETYSLNGHTYTTDNLGRVTVNDPIDEAALRRQGFTDPPPAQPSSQVRGLTVGAGEAHLGEVGGRVQVIAVVPAVSTPAYAVNDVVGTLMTFAGAARIADRTGMIQQVALFCKSAQTAALDLLLFHTNPVNSTFTDNAVLAVAVADFDKLVGVVHLGDWTSLGAPSFCQADGIAKPFKPAAGSDALYGVLVARGAMTLASTSDIKVAIKTLQD